MKIGMIGAGKVGFSLGKLFVQGGVPVTGYYSRQRESAQEAALFTHTKAHSTLAALVRESDALFFTVPDGAITSVYEEIKGYGLRGKQLCHCSGAMTAEEAFPGANDLGAESYSIHPLFPVSDKFASYRELTGAFFCLEGTGPHLNQWGELLSSLGAKVRIIPSQGKASYHAACAIASNLVCALVQESLELMAGCGFSQEEGLMALAPLMKANLNQIIAKGPQEALTGPVERGDADTVAKHLRCLTDPNDQALYRAASRKLVTLAEKRHPNASYQRLEQMLKEGSNT